MLQTVFSARSCSPFPLTLPDDAVALIAGEGGHQIRIVRPGRERVYHVSQKRYLRVLHAVVKHLGGTVNARPSGEFPGRADGCERAA
jgi:hypothetical protein